MNTMYKSTIGTILIIAGICIPIASIPLSSVYGGNDGFILRLVRVIWTGEIIFREGKIEVVEDRDEQLYKDFIAYRMQHSEMESLPEDQITERFYEERYKDRMPRVLFNLKFEKKRVVTVQKKIAVTNLYVFVSGILMNIAGMGTRMYVRRKKT
jgi:hypothetical protein